MGIPLRVLIVEDSEDDVLLLIRELRHGGYAPIFERVETSEAMTAALEKQTWDLILADYSMPHFSGLEALKLFKASGLDLPFIIVSGSIGEDVAVEAMKLGAHDYLMKNNLVRLIPAIEQELREAEVRRKLERSEKDLQESEKRYRELVENAIEIIYTVDEKGNFTYANPAGLKASGYPLAELQSFNYANLVLPEHRERVMEIYINQLRQRIPTTHVEFPFINKAGGITWFSQNASLVTEREKIVGFHIIARDITEGKKAEEALKRSEQRYRILVESSTDAILMLDLERNISTFNQAFLDMFGYKKSEVERRSVKIIHPSDESFRSFGDVFYPVIEKLGFFRGEWELRHKNGTILPVETVTSALKTADGLVLGYIAIIRDITERKAAEERLRLQSAALNAAANAIIIADHEGIIEWANPAFTVLTGYSQTETVGRNPRELIKSGEQNQAFYKDLWDTILAGKVWRGQIINRRKGGSLYTEEMTITPLRGGRGEISRFIAIKQDITKRKQAEEALREAEELYRTVLQTSPDGIAINDMEGRISFVSERVLSLYGLIQPEDVIGHSPFEFIAPEDHARARLNIQNVFKSNYPSYNQYTLVKKDGTKFTGEINSSLLRDASGKPRGMISVIRDITERKRIEEALQMTQFSVEHAPESVLWINSKGQLDYANEAACRALGYSRDELVSMFLWDIDPDFHQERWSTHWQELPKRGPSTHESNHRTKEGKIFPVEITGDYLRYGEREYNIAFVRDITERKRAEEEKIALQEQLRQSQKMEAIGQLAGGIAHDFNNLLTVIKGYSQLSQMELREGDPLKENLGEIGKAAERAANLTRQILAFSRRQMMEMRVLDLNNVLQDLDKMLRRVIGEDVELVTLLTEDPGRVKTDPGQIEQVIMNLAINARDAMPHGGKLTIETANVKLDEEYARSHIAVRPGHYVMLAVSDTGVGMAPEVRDRVFEPFFTTKEKSKGTGLGLSTVYGIVKQSGGNIWVYSEPNHGTTFKIYLPRVDEPLEELKEEMVREEIHRGGETILLVEDEVEVRKLAIRVLERQGYTVLEARDGEEALFLCQQKKEPIHLILTDVVMPQMGGPQLVEQLRQVRQDFKVVYMSGYTDNTITHRGVLEKGMNYIQKPFTIDGLARKVREVLDQ